ncbi:3435_t:CDS:2 [Entrophospora sp. SA101]|nr:3435_t:CDS:2 [Entrophospora sp. SA101]
MACEPYLIKTLEQCFSEIINSQSNNESHLAGSSKVICAGKKINLTIVKHSLRLMALSKLPDIRKAELITYCENFIPSGGYFV